MVSSWWSLQSVPDNKDISYHGFRPQILASDKDSQTSALPTSLFFSHGRPSSVTTRPSDVTDLLEKNLETPVRRWRTLAGRMPPILLDGDDEAFLSRSG